MSASRRLPRAHDRLLRADWPLLHHLSNDQLDYMNRWRNRTTPRTTAESLFTTLIVENNELGLTKVTEI